MSCSSEKSCHCKNNVILITRLYLYFLPESIIVSPVRPFLFICVIRKLAVVGFSPHAYNAGVFAKMCVIALDSTSWSIKEVIARRTRQPDYIALTLSLSHRSLKGGATM